MEVTIEELQLQIEDLKKSNLYFQSKLLIYEQNGIAKLYYALNRKANEMADMLNKSSLSSLDLTDPKDKTFERLKVIWNDSSSISMAIKELGASAGITGDEDKDIAKKPFVDTIAESRK